MRKQKLNGGISTITYKSDLQIRVLYFYENKSLQNPYL